MDLSVFSDDATRRQAELQASCLSLFLGVQGCAVYSLRPSLKEHVKIVLVCSSLRNFFVLSRDPKKGYYFLMDKTVIPAFYEVMR